MVATVHDVAAYIVQHFRSGISPMKLQKLSFFSQGWGLALLGKPLFPEKFEAWVNGPVCYELFDIHRGDWSVDSWEHGDATKLDKREQIVIDAVLKNFGALSGRELSEMTHEPGTPWSRTRERAGVKPSERTRADISEELMKDYFSNQR